MKNIEKEIFWKGKKIHVSFGVNTGTDKKVISVIHNLKVLSTLTEVV